MHVASANPQYLDRAAVPTAALDREREVLRGQAETSGKSADIVERMVDGRLGKFYEDNVLLDQVFISPDADGKSRVGQVVAAAAKAAGSEVRVTGFVRFALGEGIEKPASDFAAEVGAQLKH
jgi:elongation factor Ts